MITIILSAALGHFAVWVVVWVKPVPVDFREALFLK